MTIDSAFAADYTCNDLGSAPGVPASYGGVTFLDANTLLLGGAANGASGAIYSMSVTRDLDGHIIGLGDATLFATAPNIDGGLAFGPDGVLFTTGYPTNTLIQIAPGADSPGKVIALSSLGIASSVGTLQFVPDGFDGAGGLKLASYNAGIFYDVSLTPDGAGFFDVSVNSSVFIGGGPEGLVYVSGSNTGFGVDSLMVSEYSTGQVGIWDIDANGNPVLGTRRTFLSGLTGAEGAVIDPVTGDFIFSTFGGGNRVLVVSGFEAPTQPPTGAIPEPSTWAMLILGFGAAGTVLRSRRRAMAA
ncbi:PEPxxWA-CTERM sorting domain-containing protein [Phenylobacterium sp.]|uniref:PEPxxWA-CTERM sorting domain-containing protein n=1 Tax=Phenylobacterium sp. TaxID=1871053 RepID=UPI00301D8749